MSVSVVIPAYNAERHVADAVRSALSQTRPPLEIIVVDDGSTDATRSAVEALADPRVRCISQPNLGPAEARNTGIRNATGEFVAFLDADDLWLPTKLDKQLPLFAAPSVGVVYCREINVDPSGRRSSTGRPKPARGNVLPALVYANLTFPSSVVIRSALLARHGLLFPQGRFFCEDWEFWFLLAQVTSFDYVDEILVHMRKHGGNLTGDFESIFRGNTFTRDKIIAHVMHPGRYPPAERRRLLAASRKGRSLHLLRYGHALLGAGRTAEARRAMTQALALDFWNLHNHWGLVKLCLVTLLRQSRPQEDRNQ